MMKESILFLFFIFLSNTFYPQTKWPIDKDSMNIAVLISDYQTYQFEEGNLSYYAAIDSIVNKIPMESEFVPVADYGSISFLANKSKDTIFSAGIEWQGQGTITFPKYFQPADSFSALQTNIQAPLSAEYYFNSIPMIDSSIYKMKADSAWEAVKSLDIVNEFAKYPYRIGIYLYTPGEGVQTQNGFSNTVGAKWIIFLYYDNSAINGIDNSKRIPNQFRLMQNFPNPFNPTTIIEYRLPQKEIVTLKVYDILGREIKSLINEMFQNPGMHKIIFDGRNLSSGVYFYKLTIKGNSLTLCNKMILLK